MSSYLQRLVQTAAQPVKTLHPLTGSLFAPSHENQSSGLESEESVITDPPTAARATSQHQEIPERKPRRDINPLQKYRHIASIRSATPFPSEDATDVSPSRQEQLVRSPRPAAHLEAHAEQTPTPVFPKTQFQPLMPRDAAPAEPQPNLAPFHPELRPSRDSRPPTGLPHSSDDIQIHIGRIEVTAVHPPTQRTAKAPDRGLSLDSYLNRRAR
jgi:hypothetical protein